MSKAASSSNLSYSEYILDLDDHHHSNETTAPAANDNSREKTNQSTGIGLTRMWLVENVDSKGRVVNTSSRSLPLFFPPEIDHERDETEMDEDDYEYCKQYLSPETKERIENDTTLTDYDRMVIQRLALRKWHIPGNTFWEDYFFWFDNNHPILCFWMADPRHPLGLSERIINLLASLAFGLSATCCVVLWFFYHKGTDFEKTFIELFGFEISVGMISVFAFSGPLHVAFDIGIFFLQSCPPCRIGGILYDWLPESHKRCWLWVGSYLASLLALAAVALAINVTLVRASIEEDGNGDNVTMMPQHYFFVLLYCAEVVVANFVAFPICSFIIFSGVLGCCGIIPGLGGRPYQVKKWERLQERKRLKIEKQLEDSSSPLPRGGIV